MDEHGRAEGGVTVGRAAAEIGVSVRTLHHWDEIGVAQPSGRNQSGYRSYLPVDIARLRRVVLLRDLRVPLARSHPHPPQRTGRGTTRGAHAASARTRRHHQTTRSRRPIRRPPARSRRGRRARPRGRAPSGVRRRLEPHDG
ncbi:MerR family transcriptional regulator [Plantibacter cousiniae (nom. nud.)]|uniref:MerR family transcriptional regulator n=1 Tax=Plantibacter cousiniae (nom. nud.) TaxID=199709 RepID=UPI00338DEC04